MDDNEELDMNKNLSSGKNIDEENSLTFLRDNFNAINNNSSDQDNYFVTPQGRHINNPLDEVASNITSNGPMQFNLNEQAEDEKTTSDNNYKQETDDNKNEKPNKESEELDNNSKEDIEERTKEDTEERNLNEKKNKENPDKSIKGKVFKKLFGSNKKTSSFPSLLKGNGFAKKFMKIVGLFSPFKIAIFGGILFFFLIFYILVYYMKDYLMLDLTSSAPSGYSERNASLNTNISNDYIENQLVYLGGDRTNKMLQSLSNNDILFVSGENIEGSFYGVKGIEEVQKIINEGKRKFIVVSPSLEDINYADKYIDAYTLIINNNPNIKIYFTSINPIEESKLVENESLSEEIRSITNDQITKFNEKIKSVFPDNYIDTYSKIQNIVVTYDGVNYDDSTNKEIHSIILNHLKSNYTLKFLDYYPKILVDNIRILDGSTSSNVQDVIGREGIEKVEAYIEELVNLGGKCTPAGVAGAAVGLIDGLYQAGGIAIPYQLGGGHNLSAFTAGKIRVDGNWGQAKRGLDCTGFVHWATKAAGIDLKISPTMYAKTYAYGHEISYEEAYPGAYLNRARQGERSGHSAILIEVTDTGIISAEASTSPFAVQFKYFSMAAAKKKYKVYDVAYIYEEKCVVNK